MATVIFQWFSTLFFPKNITIKSPTPTPKQIPAKNFIISKSKIGFDSDVKEYIITAENINKSPLKIISEFFIVFSLFCKNLTRVLK